MCIHQSPHRGIYILYDPPMSVYSKVMSKGIHNITFFYTRLICNTIYRRRKAFRVMVRDTPTTVHIVTTVYSKYTTVTYAVMS